MCLGKILVNEILEKNFKNLLTETMNPLIAFILLLVYQFIKKKI